MHYAKRLYINLIFSDWRILSSCLKIMSLSKIWFISRVYNNCVKFMFSFKHFLYLKNAKIVYYPWLSYFNNLVEFFCVHKFRLQKWEEICWLPFSDRPIIFGQAINNRRLIRGAVFIRSAIMAVVFAESGPECRLFFISHLRKLCRRHVETLCDHL